MRKSLVVGILRETKEGERRVPLTPADVHWLKKRRIKVEVQSSQIRIFKDGQYRASGAKILDRFKKASLLVGIKEPDTGQLHRNKIYMVFSHTIKGQKQNIALLKEMANKKITLIDYEKITDLYGKRLVYFGRFAGICGLVDSLCYFGKKMEWRGMKTPFLTIKPAHNYISLKELKDDMIKLAQEIDDKGFDRRLSPFIIGITGHGHVSLGVQEMLEPLHPIEIHPKDMLKFVQHQRRVENKVYKIILHREEKLRSKDGTGFYFEDYLKHPGKFESNLDVYLPYLNILIHTSYWDRRYPRLVTKEMIDKLYKKDFRLQLISDISCDINGSIELTYKATSSDEPAYTYAPKSRKCLDGYKSDGITILAQDNLPNELPKDSSRHFSKLVREYIYQIAAHGKKDVINHVALPREIRQAVIAQYGKLTRNFNYLKKCLDE